MRLLRLNLSVIYRAGRSGLLPFAPRNDDGVSMTGPEPKDDSDRQRTAGDGSAPLLTTRSEDLLQGGRQLRILHGGEEYRLVLTRNNKLILQK
jgi:hemin uptake protein HemP